MIRIACWVGVVALAASVGAEEPAAESARIVIAFSVVCPAAVAIALELPEVAHRYRDVAFVLWTRDPIGQVARFVKGTPDSFRLGLHREAFRLAVDPAGGLPYGDLDQPSPDAKTIEVLVMVAGHVAVTTWDALDAEVLATLARGEVPEVLGAAKGDR